MGRRRYCRVGFEESDDEDSFSDRDDVWEIVDEHNEVLDDFRDNAGDKDRNSSDCNDEDTDSGLPGSGSPFTSRMPCSISSNFPGRERSRRL